MRPHSRKSLARLDRHLYRKAPRRSVLLGAAAVPAGRAADSGVLWVGLSAAVAVAGGRFGRRAALRGILAGLLASAVATGPVKWMVRRRRPPGTRISGWIPGLSAPVTSSFPSSHTATAFAFATGMSQEVPWLAAPTTALAGLVGYSRVHTGVHFPSDVVAGAALGVAAGLATRRIWPVAPHSPTHLAALKDGKGTAPSPQGKGLVIIVNNDAGRGGPTAAVADEIRAGLPEAEVLELDDGAGFEALLDQLNEQAAALGVVGGDGSVNAAAHVASERGIPLLVVPGGTLNHFAQALGITSVADAIEAVNSGRLVEVDRATIDGFTFVNTASFGSYVDLVDAREKLEARIGKWPAVVVALARVLRRSRAIEVELDGARRRVWMVFIGNCRYHPAGFAPSWREQLDDGQLDIRIVDGTAPWSRVRLLLSVLTGRLARCRSYEQRYQRRVTVHSTEGPLRLARDGETFAGPEEFTIAKCDNPLLVFVPPR